MTGRGTTNHELDAKLKGTTGYLGARSVDQIPNRLRAGQSLIVNLQDSTQGGSHWVCVAVLPRHVLYFCPFGGAPDPRVLAMMERSRGRRSIINTTSQYQHSDSGSCGHFCVYVLRRLSEGVSLYDVLYTDLDPMPTKRNERVIHTLWKQM